MTDRAPNALEFHSLTKRYGQVVALDYMSCTFPTGQLTALLGPNGAGKTTSIEIALGLERPDEGFASVFGLQGREAVQRGLVGVVQQTSVMPERLTVREILELIAHANGKNMKHVDDIIDVTNISSLLNRRVNKCSGGQQQRVRVAMAMVARPHLLILDEPTVGMDVESRQEFWRFIMDQSSQGLTVIFATHYLAEAQDFADRAVIINHGTVLANDTIEHLRQEYAGFTLRALHHNSQDELMERLRSCGQYVDWNVELTQSTLQITGRDLDDAIRAVCQCSDVHHLTVNELDLESVYTSLIAGRGEDRA